jgi:hypothetical protein
MSDLNIGGGFGIGGAANVGAALLFIQASTNTMDVASALNSSPWTAQSFGADPDKRAACMEYVHHSMGISGFYCVSAGLLAHSWWPVLGWAIAAAYMYWLYMRALQRACAAGSTTWDSPGAMSSPAVMVGPVGSYAV